MTEKKYIEIADVQDEYRYRKILLTLLIGVKSDLDLLKEKGGVELATKGMFNATSAWGNKIGAHIARDFNLPKTIEGALELLIIYNAIWNTKKHYIYMEDGAGYYVLEDCTWWDSTMKLMDMKCDRSCREHEMPNVLSTLLDMNEYNLELLESKPQGHERCVVKITKK